MRLVQIALRQSNGFESVGLLGVIIVAIGTGLATLAYKHPREYVPFQYVIAWYYVPLSRLRS